jgi:hypothetical protein
MCPQTQTVGLLRAGTSALIGPLANLLLLGYGPKTVVETALTGIPGVQRAFIGGSWAARYHGQHGAFPNDVDVIVVGKPDATTSPRQWSRRCASSGTTAK